MIGEIVNFGIYRWILIDEKDDKLFLLSEDIIDQQNIHERDIDVTWETCSLRLYLNTTFLHSFTTQDQSCILETQVHTPDNLWYKSFCGNDTVDKIFILSMDEIVRSYFGDSSDLLDNPSEKQRYWFQRKDINNETRMSSHLDKSWWWTRTPGKKNRFFVYIQGDGNIGIQGNGISQRNTNIIHPITNSNKGGVRPCMWIKKDAISN